MATLHLPAAAIQEHGLSQKQVRAAERREQQRRARERLWPLLNEVFPEAFRVPAVPLAIGIHHQILEVAGDSIDPAELSAFLRYWVSRWSYLQAVKRGEPRRNLDGSLAGLPTIEQRNDAARRLWGERAQPIVEHIIAEPSEPGHT
jgi:sRNA-binding protein